VTEQDIELDSLDSEWTIDCKINILPYVELYFSV